MYVSYRKYDQIIRLPRLSLAPLAVHVFVCQYVLQHEHGVLLTVPVGALQLGEHSPDLRGVVRNVYLRLIGFQDRVPGAPRLRPVGLALVLFGGLTDDLLDARLAVLFLAHGFVSHFPINR